MIPLTEVLEPHRLVDDGLVFASGLSRSSRDLQEAIARRMPVGVSVHASLSEPIRRLLVDYVNDGGRLFIDSGAFTAFTSAQEVDWRTVMGRYRELFHRIDLPMRAGLYFVAPDCVGDADATADLQAETYGMFTFLMEDGGNVIVPCHKGPSGICPGDLDTWWPRDTYPHRFIIGLPYNKAAWSEAEVLAWMARDPHEDKRLHLLGGGPSKVRSLVATARAYGLRYATITGDSFHGPARDRKFHDRPRRLNVQASSYQQLPLLSP